MDDEKNRDTLNQEQVSQERYDFLSKTRHSIARHPKDPDAFVGQLVIEGVDERVVIEATAKSWPVLVDLLRAAGYPVQSEVFGYRGETFFEPKLVIPEEKRDDNGRRLRPVGPTGPKLNEDDEEYHHVVLPKTPA